MQMDTEFPRSAPYLRPPHPGFRIIQASHKQSVEMGPGWGGLTAMQ